MVTTEHTMSRPIPLAYAMKYIKHTAIAALFIIGAVENLFTFGIAMVFYAFSPQTSRVFATAEQHQLYQWISLLLTKAILLPSGDQDGTFMVPCPP